MARGGGKRSMIAYPYTRTEECSWQPEDVARHMAALLAQAAGGNAAGNTNTEMNSHPNHNPTTTTPHLLSTGWSTRQVALHFRRGSEPATRDLVGKDVLPPAFSDFHVATAVSVVATY